MDIEANGKRAALSQISKVTEEAVPPEHFSSPNIPLTALAGLVLAFLLAILAVCGGAVALYVAIEMPERFLSMPRNRPGTWRNLRGCRRSVTAAPSSAQVRRSQIALHWRSAGGLRRI